MAPSFRERFWEVICGAEAQLQFLLVFVVTMLVLGGIAVPLVDPGSLSWYLLVVDLAMFGGLLLVALLFLLQCRRRRQAPRAETRTDG
jgi:hypothetical protein